MLISSGLSELNLRLIRDIKLIIKFELDYVKHRQSLLLRNNRSLIDRLVNCKPLI